MQTETPDNIDLPPQERNPISCTFAILRLLMYGFVYAWFSGEKYDRTLVEWLFRTHSVMFFAELIADYYLGITYGQYMGGCVFGIIKWGSLGTCMWMAWS
jgi:hypothetical protein